MEQINFFQKIRNALTRPTYYVHVTKEGTNKAVNYLLLFTILVTFVFSTLNSFILSSDLDEAIHQIVTEEISFFEIKDGKLTIEQDEPYVYTDGSTVIFILDVTDTYTFSDLAGYASGVLLSKDSIFLSQRGTDPVSAPYDTLLSPLGYDDFNTNDLADFLHGIKFFALILFVIFSIIGSIFVIFFAAFIMLLLGFLLRNANKLSETLTTKDLFKMCLYSLTGGILAENIYSLLTTFVPALAIPFVGIFLFYGISAFLLHKGLQKYKLHLTRLDSSFDENHFDV